MSIPIIGDFKKPQLNNTEKAIAMLQAENMTLRNWNMGLQRQLAGLMIHFKIPVNTFIENTRNQEIDKFLQEAQEIETKMIQADQAKADEKLKNIEEFKENGNTETKETSPSSNKELKKD